MAFFGTLLFSLKSIFIKLLYQQGLDADSVLVLRMAIALPIYLVVCFSLLRKEKRRSTLNSSLILKMLLLGFLGYYLASLLDLMGLERISAQLERLTLFTYPLFVGLLGFLIFKERLSYPLIIALVGSYIGLWLVMSQGSAPVVENTVIGLLLVLGSAFSFAFYLLFSKAVISRIGSPLFTSIAMLASCVFGLLHGAIFIDWSQLVISGTAFFWLLMLAIVSTVIPSFMISEAIQGIGAFKTSMVGMLGPIFTIILAVLFLEESVTVMGVFGMLLVISSVATIQLKRINNH